MASDAKAPLELTPMQLFTLSHIKTKPIPPPATLNLSGQTAIVTGSNTGIGFQAARVLLEHNLSHLIIAVRSINKGEAAAQTLRKDFPKAQIDVWQLDMLSYDSIQSFVKRCHERLDRLDRALLNAGVLGGPFVTSPSTGHEVTFQVNYISTALLAILLLPVLKNKSPKGKPGTLTLISSALGLQCAFPNRDADPIIPSFDNSEGWNMQKTMAQYSLSKMCVLMLLQKLAEHVDARDVIINAAEPGFTPGSGLGRQAPWLFKVLMWLFTPLLALMSRSERQAAWAEVHAVAVVGKESHGGFVMNWDIFP
jgi:NAD(P)-dependent dehydrogenase (short-subunit alcohol dehydrogenase family)